MAFSDLFRKTKTKPNLSRRSRPLTLDRLEPRRLLDASAPAILQWFEADYDVIEDRMPDLFSAGYGSVWLPPPGRADMSDFSVGYDVYDRFDLGRPRKPTLYGTRTGLESVADELHRAGINLHVDTIINHAGFSDISTTGFTSSGGYPGLAITLGNDIDGDFHGAFESGDIKGRLAGLVDINHGKNHQMIRHPVVDGNAQNIPAGSTADAAGRLANVPSPQNRQYYPDRDASPMMLFDPATGESNIAVFPFVPDCGDCGDPLAENAMGYLMRYMQWMVQDVGVDGFRIDAAKHVEPFVMDFVDRAVYRSNPRQLLDGSPQHVFSYSEVFTGDTNALLSFVKKNIDPGDIGRIGGNRDALDFSLFFAMRDNLASPGTTNAWQNIRDSSMDVADDGLHNGSAGVMFVQSHDEHGPAALNNVAYAYMLMQPGNAVVYFNGKQFGENRDFPKDGRGDALGGVYGDAIETLVGIRNTHGRGNYQERWIDNEGIFAFERISSSITGLSNRGDGGFDQRTVQVALAPGTHLIELTGNAANATIDPFNDISEVLTVSNSQTIDLRIPRNKNANNEFHGNGYVIYGLSGPQSIAGLEIIGADSLLTGSIPAANDFDNGKTRLSDLHVVTANSFQARLLTNEVRLLGLDSLRDVFADGDHALLKLDAGLDVNGNGGVDFVTPGDVSYGFEVFGDKSSPLVGPAGIGGVRGDGEFLQTIDATKLSEGVHHLESRAFRHRTDGGPAIFNSFKQSVYIDRFPPESELLSFEPFTAGVNENRDMIVRSVDKTADSVHVFLNLPANMSDASIILQAEQGGGLTNQIDRDQFVYGFFDVKHGNNVATIVSFERTGNVNVQRQTGLFTSTIIGAGLGDLNTDGTYTPADIATFATLLKSDNSQFHPAADLNGDGLIDLADLTLLGTRLTAVSATEAVQVAYQQLVQDATIQLSFSLESISEDDGPNAAILTLSRDLSIDSSDFTVTLTSNDNSELTIPASASFALNASTATVNIQAVDDALLDGNQVVHFTASADPHFFAGAADYTVTDHETLTATIDSDSVAENGGAAVATVVIQRSNVDDLSQSLLISLNSSDTSELTVPATLTIAANATSASVTVDAVDDLLLDGIQHVNVTATAMGYIVGGGDTIAVTDYETLSLVFDETTISENAGPSAATATVSRSNTADLGQVLIVNLSNSDATELAIPAEVLILAGSATTTFNLAAVDDRLLDGTQTATVIIDASGYAVAASQSVNITDHETIVVSIDKDSVAENDGTAAATATISRSNTDDLSAALTVNLLSNDITELTVAAFVVIAANTESAVINLDAVDDLLLDGSQSVNISASAVDYFAVAVGDIIVTDSETIGLSLDKSQIPENSASAAAILTVTRSNTDNLSDELVVTLASSDITELTLPPSVTIAANETSASASITAVDDRLLDATQSVTITATATGYDQPLSAIMEVTDHETLLINIESGIISEFAGAAATFATITRSNIDDLGQTLTVNASSNDTTEVQTDATVVFAAGSATVNLPVHAIDDKLLDGRQTVIISVNAEGYAAPTHSAILVDDYETLTIVVNTASVIESGGPNATTATISRSNTDDLASSLTVITASGDLTELQVASSWNIPSDAASVVITVDAIDDLILDGTQTVALSAAAVGYVASAVATIDVLDHETWINPFNQLDVTADSNVLPNDALAVINAINTGGARELPDRGSVDEQQVLFVDVNGDGWLAPGDALFVINYLNANSANDGEGEWLGAQMPQHHHNSDHVNPATINASPELADLGFQNIQHWPTTAIQPAVLGRNAEQSPEELETLESLIDQLVNDISEQWHAS